MSSKAQNHPPTIKMIEEAIRRLGPRNGASVYAIKKFIAGTYNLDMDKIAPHIKKALKKGLQDHVLEKATGSATSVSGSFKLAKVKQPVIKKKVETEKEKKPAPPKPSSTTKGKSEAKGKSKSTGKKKVAASKPKKPVPKKTAKA